MAKITRLPLPHIPSHDEMRAKVICGRVKEAHQHVAILRLAMLGSAGENGLDFEKHALIDAAYDLESELSRLHRDMTDPKVEGDTDV
jgi:hypothetical protein